MFYSHEILASPQYGVATVWLVANLGHTTTSRKLNRKTIENVNVPRACSTIEKPPGAPIALRLQGSLLYGVTGVYSKHGVYLLDDAEKMWTRMRTFYRDMKYSATNEIDLSAGKTKRKQLVIDDDPSFVPDFDLPPLEFNESGELLLPGMDLSQGSKLYSQYSPLDHSSASPANAPLINLDIRRSSSQGSLGIPSLFDKENHTQVEDGNMPPIFGDEEELPFADLGLTIDADGNFIEEPELPPHPIQKADESDEALKKAHSDAHLPEDEAPIFPGDEEFQMILGNEEQLPATQDAMKHNKNEVPLPSEEPLSSEPDQQPAQPQRQKKRKRVVLVADDATHVGRSEFRDWSTGYITRIEQARSMPLKITAAKAKENAYNFVFGMGIGDVGIFNGILDLNHELAELFSGASLKERVPGYGEKVASQGNRRRSASVAFGSEEEGGESDRRVRSRVDEAADAGQAQEGQAVHDQQDAQVPDDAMVVLGNDQDLLPEAGREGAGSALSDHRRSSNVPWNRPSSAVPSSVGKNVEDGRNDVEGSPLVGRGSILQPSDVKFSDGGAPAHGSEGFAPTQNDGANEFSSYSEFGAAAGVSTQEANTSQFMRKALDREGRNFLGFAERVATDRGRKDAEDESLRWVDFDGLFDEQDKTKPVVSQAFLHILTLATRNQIKVIQDGVKNKIPFGGILVGVSLPSDGANEDDNLEELEGYEEFQNAKE